MMLIEDLQPDLPPARGHGGYVQSILLSLLARGLLRLNGLHTGGGIVEVRTSHWAHGVQVDVEDDPRPAAAVRHHGDATREISGPGLSLAACRTLARSQGWDLHVAQDGPSSRLTLQLRS